MNKQLYVDLFLVGITTTCLKFRGVHSVSINQEKRLVIVLSKERHEYDLEIIDKFYSYISEQENNMRCWWLFFHRWNKWQTSNAGLIQERFCEKCNRKQGRKVYYS